VLLQFFRPDGMPLFPIMSTEIAIRGRATSSWLLYEPVEKGARAVTQHCESNCRDPIPCSPL
jgi:hypothetical protein